MSRNEKKRPVIGVALGGGVARGMAHVGVLRELEKNGIPIDLISGTSAGALVGSLYATGLTPDQIEDLAYNLRWSDLGRVTVSRLGFYNNERTEAYLASKCPVRKFEETRIPLGVVATDLQSGRMVVFTEGDIPLAVRASCAIPCYFTPVIVNGRMIVDGGLVGHLPASVARSMGADIVIAVDVNSKSTPIAPPTNIFTIMSQSLSIMGRSSVAYLYQDADVVVSPNLASFELHDLRQARGLIKAGEEAAQKTMPAIKRLLMREKPGFFKRLFARPVDERRVMMLR
ncbi:MAG TPA: patatin-like phospholipase family protein [Blastocatellia bacterium]|nr:patatin-like phospholipase family protein [Blastocatellia bacterium]